MTCWRICRSVGWSICWGICWCVGRCIGWGVSWRIGRCVSWSKAFKIALLHYGELTSEILPIQPHDEKIDAAATPEIVVRF